MSKVVAISGLRDVPAPPAPRTMLLWGLVFGTTVGIFIGTLMMSPARKRGG